MATGDDGASWGSWGTGGVALGATMLGSGAFIGYRMQLTESGPSSAMLDAALKVKPHPFLKGPKRAAPAAVNVTQVAVKGAPPFAP
jgi:hypothetical protein